MTKLIKLNSFDVLSDNEGCGELIVSFDNDRHHSCVFKKGYSRDLVVKKLRSLADNLEHDPNLNNNELPLKTKAPWPDYAGNDIYEGDVIEHPSGDRGTVVLTKKDATKGPNYEWKVDYGDGYLSWLGLQIGNKGQAVVVHNDKAPEAVMTESVNKHFHETWKMTDDICIIFDDKTGDNRTPEEIDRLFIDLKEAANKHGFDLSSWGVKRIVSKIRLP